MDPLVLDISYLTLRDSALKPILETSVIVSIRIFELFRADKLGPVAISSSPIFCGNQLPVNISCWRIRNLLEYIIPIVKRKSIDGRHGIARTLWIRLRHREYAVV